MRLLGEVLLYAGVPFEWNHLFVYTEALFLRNLLEFWKQHATLEQALYGELSAGGMLRLLLKCSEELISSHLSRVIISATTGRGHSADQYKVQKRLW